MNNSQSEWNLFPLWPKLITYLGTNDLLRCSAVSQNWNGNVTTAIQQLRKQLLTWTFERQLPCLTLRENAQESQIQQFLAAKDDRPIANPSVFSCVAVSDEEEEDGRNERTCQNFLQFFQRFGRYIYQLQLKSNTKSLVQMTRLLVICLTTASNLQVLEIRFNRGIPLADTPEAVDIHLTESPLPSSTLQKLRIFSDYGYDCCPTKIIEILLSRYGNQLMDVYDFFDIPIVSITARGITFQSLKVVQGTIYGFKFFQQGTSRLDTFTQLLRNLNPTLEDVHILLYGEYERFGPSFANFFQVLQETQPQITTFRLMAPLCALSFSLQYLDCMQMPNLKKLALGEVGIPPVQFFERATPALEHLTIYRRNNDEQINPAAFMNAMWKALPNCKTIKLQNFSFHRPRI